MIKRMCGTAAHCEVSSREAFYWDEKEWSLMQNMRDEAIEFARDNGAIHYVLITAEDRILEREVVPKVLTPPPITQGSETSPAQTVVEPRDCTPSPQPPSS